MEIKIDIIFNRILIKLGSICWAYWILNDINGNPLIYKRNIIIL
jgi:hypothetical protein